MLEKILPKKWLSSIRSRNTDISGVAQKVEDIILKAGTSELSLEEKSSKKNQNSGKALEKELKKLLNINPSPTVESIEVETKQMVSGKLLELKLGQTKQNKVQNLQITRMSLNGPSELEAYS